MDHYNDMAIFARVVERTGFTAAAGDLGLSKSAVSKAVARLEDRLGLRLLNRTTRRLSVTEAGGAFYEGCQRMVAEAEAAGQAVSHLAAAPRGTLKVSAPMSFGQHHLLPGLSDFLKRCPEMKIDVALNDRRVDLVEEGFDLGIRVGNLADSSLIARRLAPNRLAVAAAPAYLAAQGHPAAPEDLAAHACLLYAYAQAGESWHFAGPGGRRAVKVSGPLRVNNGDGLLSAAIAGLGIVVLPSFICGEALRDGRLTRLLLDWRAADTAVHAVYPASRNLSPKVRVFIDFLVERFGHPPYWDAGVF